MIRVMRHKNPNRPSSQRQNNSSPTPPEIEESRRVEKEINPNITKNIPQCTLQEVDQSVHPSTSPQEEEESSTEEHTKLAIVTVDSRASMSSARDDDLEASRGASHEDSNPRTNMNVLPLEEVDIRASPSLA